MVLDIEIQHLSVYSDTAQGPVYVVNGLSTTFQAGRISDVIGESGNGKNVMGMPLPWLLPNTARVTGRCFFGGDELYSMPLWRLRRLRGTAIGPILQNPGASLGPVMKLRRQLIEAITIYGCWKRREVEAQAAELFRRFGFEEPGRILNRYSFQTSGDTNQRLVSVLGLAYRPGRVIADEPTKDLGTVTHNQMYSVLCWIYTEHYCSMFIITHDLVLARWPYDDIRVLHMGRIIEQDTTEEVMERPHHLYTDGLIRSLPNRGMVLISPLDPRWLEHTDCPFYPHCPRAIECCGREMPREATLPTDGKVRCFLCE